MKKILPLTVVENDGRFEVRLDGKLIQIRTRGGTWMQARFKTLEAANAYRRALIGAEFNARPLNRDLH